MKTQKITVACLLLLGWLAQVTSTHALTGVNPTGVNVRTTGPTTVFLTFQGVSGQVSDDAFWCGDITVPANTVVNSDPCVPGTYFGRLPRRLDLSRSSAGAAASGDDLTLNGVGNTNLTDIMTIPASVARRAYQAAKNGNKSSFFYVRKFSSDGVDQYVAVTCRLAGGGARVPLALMHVTPYFKTENGRQPVHLLAQGERAPAVGATLHYNGSGRLKGRWEIVQPGDPLPSDFDLLPEASLPQEQRNQQQRYAVLERFDVFMPATGRIELSGPAPSKIPVQVNGPYQLLLRIEATRDKEGDSDTGTGVVNSGGLAGFSMPPLRYYVANADAVAAARNDTTPVGELRLLQPTSGQLLTANTIDFTWRELHQAELYRIELRNEEATQWSAYVKPGVGHYLSPPWWQAEPDQVYRWRVIALGRDQQRVAQSSWRELMIRPIEAVEHTKRDL